MIERGIKGKPVLLDKLNPEIGAKLVKAVADDMERAKQAREEQEEQENRKGRKLPKKR